MKSCLVVACLLIGPSAVSALDWSPFSSTRGNFRTVFPAQPEESAQTIETDLGSIAYTTYMAEIEDGNGNVDDSERRRRHARHSRATRDGNPDFSRKLRSDVVEPESRNQADHRAGHGGGGNH